MGEKQEKAFKEIKKSLTNAPALGLPDVMKPFFLYVHERCTCSIYIYMSIDSCRSLHPAANFLAQPGGLFIKVT
jgi:hypothetical protein